MGFEGLVRVWLSRPMGYPRHTLLNCEQVSPATKDKAKEKKTERRTQKSRPVISNDGESASSTSLTVATTPAIELPNGSGERPAKRQKSDALQQNFVIVSSKRWSPNRQHDFHRNMCDLFVSCGLAWNTASNPQFEIFCRKWIPGSVVPDRRELARRVLTERVRDVEGDIKQRVKGQLATGQCDGWKNIAKMPLIASMITVGCQVSVAMLI